MMPMKGLLKGLRYISQIFDNEKEEEIQIGFPTDVKHVAHIGMDGPSANTPSWMNKYDPNSEASPTLPNAEFKNKPSTKSLAEEAQRSSNPPLDSPTHRNSSKTKHSRRNHSSNSSTGSGEGDAFNLSKPRRHKNSGEMGSPTSERPRRHKHSGKMGSPTSERPRRHKHSGEMGSPTSERPRRHKHSGEMGSPTSERPRRHKHSDDIGSPTSEQTRRLHNQNIGSDSPSENGPKIPKSHRKKSKGSSGSGLMKSSRSKETSPYPESSPYSDPGPSPGFKNDEVRSNPVYEEGNEYEEISRGIRAL